MYTNNQQFLLLLDSMNFSKHIINKFCNNFSDRDDYINSIIDNKINALSVFSSKELEKIKTAILNKNHLKIIEKLNKMKIFCLFKDSQNYPKHYLNIDEMPHILYTIGDTSLLSTPMISIIGTRKPTRYGKEVVSIFVKGLSKSGIVLVSDLAYGIDGLVASETLDNKGKTIALLAGGFSSIYPTSHTNLAKQIVKNGGLLITQYKPETKPEKSYFIERNKMLAAISDGLLLIEAGENSATINTINNAINYGRDIFVVPGNITSDMSRGTNNLISEIPDSFTISPNEIIEKLGFEIKTENETYTSIELSLEESIIIDALYGGELSFDELQEKTKLNVKTLATLLTTLEINGLIKKLPGNYYEKF